MRLDEDAEVGHARTNAIRPPGDQRLIVCERIRRVRRRSVQMEARSLLRTVVGSNGGTVIAGTQRHRLLRPDVEERPADFLR